MDLLPNEQVLLKSPGGSLVLTTHRVRYEVQAAGSGTLISIMLEEIASCGTIRSSSPVLLVIAAIVLIIGLVVSGSTGGYGSSSAVPFGIGLIIALLFVVFYYASRQQMLALASAGATIRVNVVGMKAEMVRDFINQLEAAKNTRYLTNHGAA